MKNEESVGDYVTDDDELVCHILLVLKGGGKRRITPAETLPRESDPEGVKALLNEKTFNNFNIRQFVKTLTADELQEYKKDLEGNTRQTHHAMATLGKIKPYIAIKVGDITVVCKPLFGCV